MINVFVALGRGFKVIGQFCYRNRAELARAALSGGVSYMDYKLNKGNMDTFELGIENLELGDYDSKNSEINAVKQLIQSAKRMDGGYYREKAAEKIYNVYKDKEDPKLRAAVAEELAGLSRVEDSEFWREEIFDYATALLK